MQELIIDSFAGGGGASYGIQLALGRGPDIAINHDAEAIAMHAINHPDTLHYQNNVWQIDPENVTNGQPVGLAWFSPDCKHHSKAKGGAPVSRNIRDLAWVVVVWAKRAKPRVIFLENVEEFADWGPLTMRDDGKMYPDPEKRGETFNEWVSALRRLGYKVEWRELRACDFGAPTIRKRLYLIARRDGMPIVWPDPTHGVPHDPDVIAGRKAPWRTAAEIIDWSLPCHSIFLNREDGRAVGVKRPLADKTMDRIAKGIWRYVIDAAKPFIVSLTHHGGDRTESLDEPAMTITGANRGEKALVVPTLIQTGYGERDGQAPRALDIEKPLGTVVAGGGKHALVAPIIARTAWGDKDKKGKKRGRGDSGPESPLPTVLASPDFAVVAPVLTRCDGDGPESIIAPHITKFRNGAIGSAADEPVHTITASSFVKRPSGSAPLGMVAAHLTKFSENSIGEEVEAPLHTVMAGAPRHGVVAAFLAQHNTGVVGHDAREPVSTVLHTGSHQAVVAAHMMTMKGSERRSSEVDVPLRVVTAGGMHHAEVRAFLTKYYGQGLGQSMDEPTHSVTTKDRFGLVMVEGEAYEIADIGMRMLSSRELFRAQGFGDGYIIDRGHFVQDDGSIRELPLTKTSQIRMCGNSVCPPMAAALIRANYVETTEAQAAIA